MSLLSASGKASRYWINSLLYYDNATKCMYVGSLTNNPFLFERQISESGLSINSDGKDFSVAKASRIRPMFVRLSLKGKRGISQNHVKTLGLKLALELEIIMSGDE